MSILVVHLVPEGLLFAADRNITTSLKGGNLILQGQAQRPKVHRWPNRDAIIGYVGQAQIGNVATDEWLFSFIGRNFDFPDFQTLARTLGEELEAAMQVGEIDDVLILHLGGFEVDRGKWTPRIWFVHNSAGLTDAGPQLGTNFVWSDEIQKLAYFGTKTGEEIRADVEQRVQGGGLFSFRQGYDLAAFNAIDEGLRWAMLRLVHGHPLKIHQVPSDLEEWAKHLKMAVLGYSAYFGAFYAPFEQYVGGGADVVSVPWPDALARS